MSQSAMSQIRIFSYLPNPRVYKSTITARLNGVSLELTGATPGELADWLWDFNARPLTPEDHQNSQNATSGKTGFSGKLFKTREFMIAHPYGTVPAAFSHDGKIGIFESNSIMRAVARLGDDKLKLYGADAYEASRIDSFLDTALLFARDSQIYLLAIGDRSISQEIQQSTEGALRKYLDGIEQALETNEFLCGDTLSIADICFVCELSLFARDQASFRVLEKIDCQPIWPVVQTDYSNCFNHFTRLLEIPEVDKDLGSYHAKIQSDIQQRLKPN